MTTIGSSHGPTEVINARRTESADAPAIHDLIGTYTLEQFGNVNVVHLIEKSNLSVTLNNEENEVLGFAGFLDHPSNEVCDSANWELWMEEMKYSVAKSASPLNSLFLHFFVAKEDYTIGCASEIVRTVFNAVPELRYIFLCVRSGVGLEQALAGVFTPLDKGVHSGNHSLYMCQRHHHVPQLHVRPATVEDHDDVMPIFKRLNNKLTEVYGNYFLAEMVEAQDENNFCLVAEAGGKAIGFISVCADVNVEFLQNSYELASFHGFCKPSPDDVLEPSADDNEEGKIDEESTIDPKKAEEVEENPTFLPDVEPTGARSTSVSQVDDVNKSAASDTVDESSQSAFRSQSSVASGPHEGTEFAPKLSELHMRPSLESVSQTEVFDVIDDADINLNIPSRSSAIKSRFTPTYHGESNVFSIQLFCMAEQYEMRSVDFLPEIFKLFPSKDIVIMTIPHLVPEFPLLQQFVRVTPRPGANVPHELYAFHRHALLSSTFRVRRACLQDYEQVECLVEHVEGKENLLSDLQSYNGARRDDDGSAIMAFVADCLDQVVGICIVRSEESIEYIRSHYNIEDFIYYNHHRRDEHGHLHHFALNPIFQPYAKHFFKEVLRQAHKSCLYYPVYPADAEPATTKQHSLITGLNFLVPVRARRQIEYPLEELGVNAPAERVVAEAEKPYALTHINRKLTLEPKVTINARVVVVGASEVGVSFLENLCFCPHLRFNNLTLVSKRGLPHSLRSTSLVYDGHEMAQMSLRSWVNVVTGLMVAIDRPRQELIMADGTLVPYDYLLLCTGQQYQIPFPTGADVDNLAVTQDLTKSAIIRPYDINFLVPENVLALNDDVDYDVVEAWATNLSTKLLAKTDHPQSIVIYGRSIEAYVTIQLLLSRGIPGDRLVLVKPPSYTMSLSVCDDGCEGDPFNEPVVNDTVAEALADAKVRVLDDHVLATWQLEQTKTGAKVVSLSFTTSTKPLIDLSCIGFLSFYPRRIEHRTFMAANDSCLVFDGRLSIDANFMTNDPRIRAAGPLTKYMRRYYADGVDYRHENYNSKEIGFRLAINILPLFDPTLDGNVEMSNAIPPTPSAASKRATPIALSLDENPQDKLVPTYVEPKITSAVLPGGYDYLHVRKPGGRVKYDIQLSDGDHGRELVTGSVRKGNYFRLHINQYRCVETITCLVRPEVVRVPASNLQRLYGIHERYLNNMVSRYDEGLISDFFVFFRESWAMALFHDRFQDFRQEIRDLLCDAPEGSKNVLSVETMVRQLADEDMAINEEQRQAVFAHYERIGRQQDVEGRLLSYLGYNYYHLPMYAKPGMV